MNCAQENVWACSILRYVYKNDHICFEVQIIPLSELRLASDMCLWLFAQLFSPNYVLIFRIVAAICLWKRWKNVIILFESYAIDQIVWGTPLSGALINSYASYRELDAQRSLRREMKALWMGIQNQDHTLKRSLYFALVHILQPKWYFLLGKKIFFLLKN